ncbi:DUF2334 domain-containing protein [Clostridium taeniosporum]|uniref:DUF2334 domain-containing protein n=1 Tax=Clostridium taeniosporum TaxID=394958 RepID=A0A1D7XMK1_9CLOT|nr:DUF2334 domain-containing protein [Clostridium taeniosporum]AOR24575.1 DUF2334 domain-containing protein [Clostridium taeniosporum]
MVKKHYFFILLLFILIFLIGCTNEENFTTKNLTNHDNNIITNNNEENLIIDNSSKSNDLISNNFSNFKGFDMNEDNIRLKLNGNNLDFTLPIYLNKNRYYIPLNEVIYNLNGKFTRNDNSLYLNINDETYSINLLNNIVKCPNKEFKLKKDLLNSDDIYYICFSDLSNMFNLYTRWVKDNKIINCKITSNNEIKNTSANNDFINNLNNTSQENQNNTTSKNTQIGLIRFEDICVTSQGYDKNYFENLRIIGEYMNEENIPYHIAWIPRYKNPNFKIDNDPLTKNNFEIAEMVYTLDYLKNNNGIIGLHGYTHQIGDNESAAGFEFGRYEPSTTIFREKIKKAIETAKYLDIPIDFFEVPHYEITPEQNKIAEEYFKILYYPFNDYGVDKADLKKPQLSPYNNSSLYISTPLDYIAESKEEMCLDRIRNSDNSNMGSVFFHPSLENKFIKLDEDSNGCPTYSYEDNSTLKKLINILKEKEYKMTKVTEL